jgi:hypothetical protein
MQLPFGLRTKKSNLITREFYAGTEKANYKQFHFRAPATEKEITVCGEEIWK